MIQYVHQFFKGKTILKSTSHTFITLIPKIAPIALEISDFRFISCVKIGKVFSEVISPNQTTSIEGMLISDNTLLADEMVNGFGRKRTPKKVLPLLGPKESI